MNLPENYIPILFQAIVAITFIVVTLTMARVLGVRRNSKLKDESFECGIESKNNARLPISIKYFLTAILFVLFDVEVIFFYPYAVNFREMGVEGFMAVVLFVMFFLLGFMYIVKRGALEWDK